LGGQFNFTHCAKEIDSSSKKNRKRTEEIR